MYISADFTKEAIAEADRLIRSKDGVCEVTPFVRLTQYGNGRHSISLVCRHADSGLNCGSGAVHCTRCQNKEKQYEANRQFGKMLGEFVATLPLRSDA